MSSEDAFGTVPDDGTGPDGGDRYAHHGLVYETREERFATLVPFCRAGLDRGDRVLAYLAETDREELLGALADDGVDVEARVAAGDLVVRSAREFYLADGEFHVDEALARLEAAVGADDEADRIRMAGELGWLADADVEPTQFLTYEARANELLAGTDVVGLCLYDADRFESSTLADVLHTHPYMAVGVDSVPNDHYRPQREFSSGDAPGVDLALSAIQRAADLQADLETYRSTLRLVTGDDLEPPVEERSPPAIAVTAIREALSPTLVGCWTYEGDDGAFELDAVRTGPGAGVDGERLLGCLEEDAWTAFVTNETRPLPADAPPPLDDGLLVPVGEYGLVAVADDASGFVDRTVRDVVDSTVAELRDAFESRARRRKVDRKDRKLETKRDRLSRLDRANTIVRNVAEAVVDASSAAAIREAVCGELGAVDAVEFAWVGEYDPVEETVVPREWTGDDADYLDAVELAVDVEGAEPTVTAAESGTVEAVAAIASDREDADWRSEALAWGFHAAIAVPLTYDEVVYGVLGVYGDETDAFDHRTRAVLGELGEVVGFAFNALERKRSLLTDEVVELTVEVRDPQSPLLGLADRADCRLVYEGAVPRTGEETVGFFAFEGADPETVAAVASESVAVADYRLLERDDDGGRIQLQLTRPFLATVLAEHGATLRRFRADGEVAEAVVAFPDAISVRAITDVLERSVDDVTLAAKRRRNHVDDDTEPGDPLSSLTERQREVLEAAYHAGYFEEPRRSDGEAVADALDIASPTFHQHRRVAVNKILEQYFED